MTIKYLTISTLVLGGVILMTGFSNLSSLFGAGGPTKGFPDPKVGIEATGEQQLVLAGGCFWCTEAVFEHFEGVTSVVSGYAGGRAETAHYDMVSAGNTGHAESIEITYDASKISFGELLKIFFSVAHDPTQLNRQGPDRGKQYRSAIFYANDEQKRVAQAYIDQLDEAGVLGKPIVTTLEPLEKFYPAETYHQNFCRRNPTQPYVVTNSLPKVKKAKEAYPDKIKP
jgi:peptide-methionine (S)-S-oxide reductase